MLHMSKIFSALALVVGLAMVSMPASAEFATNYSPAKFEEAQKNGKHIVLEVFKQGCGTCRAQQPSINAAKKAYPDAVFLAFDFVGDTDAVKRFKVVKQSTIIVFKGEDEVARLIGETAREKIIAAISKGA